MWSARSTRCGEAVERRIDLGFLGDRVCVNNATVGLYAKMVQSKEYGERKVGTVEIYQTCSDRGRPLRSAETRTPTAPSRRSGHVILVSNDRYELGARGRLWLAAATSTPARSASWLRSSGRPATAATFVRISRTSRPRHRPRGWLEWSDTSFEVRSDRA